MPVRVTYTDHEKAAPSVTVGGQEFRHNEPVEISDPAVINLIKTMSGSLEEGGKGNKFFAVEDMPSEPGKPAGTPPGAQSDEEKAAADETLRRRPGRPRKED
jgi:hypothetical protein